jgi:hypothetical protein
MKSAKRGKSTSEVLVSNIDQFGIWLLVKGTEHFLPYKDFPWFRGATIDGILNVQLANPDHLYWPALDVDLSLESLEHPEEFPLVAQTRPAVSRRNRKGRLGDKVKK